jgi:hypothetical protein
MNAIPILALLAIASPAFAEVPAEKQSAPEAQKPFVNDRLMPNDSRTPAPEAVPGTTITAGGDKTYIYDSATKQLPSQQPIITPYSPDKPGN